MMAGCALADRLQCEYYLDEDLIAVGGIEQLQRMAKKYEAHKSVGH